jgi:regulatory protein
MFKKAKSLKDPSSVEHGYEYALFLLSLRLRTVGEMRDKMAERGYEPEVVEQAMERLLSLRYIDDRRYAEVYLDNFKRFKTYGQFFIKQKMYQKKLPKQVVEEVLAEQLTVDDEIAIAERMLSKSFPEFMMNKESFSYEEKQKIAHRLAARGFSGQVVSMVVFE